jgi:hypothetical protein
MRGTMTHSMPGVPMGCAFFFSGFSNTHTRPLSWQRRHGDWCRNTGPGGQRRATVGERDGRAAGLYHCTHLSFAAVFPSPAVRTSYPCRQQLQRPDLKPTRTSSASLWDVNGLRRPVGTERGVQGRLRHVGPAAAVEVGHVERICTTALCERRLVVASRVDRRCG